MECMKNVPCEPQNGNSNNLILTNLGDPSCSRPAMHWLAGFATSWNDNWTRWAFPQDYWIHFWLQPFWDWKEQSCESKPRRVCSHWRRWKRHDNTVRWKIDGPSAALVGRAYCWSWRRRWNRTRLKRRVDSSEAFQVCQPWSPVSQPFGTIRRACALSVRNWFWSVRDSSSRVFRKRLQTPLCAYWRNDPLC